LMTTSTTRMTGPINKNLTACKVLNTSLLLPKAGTEICGERLQQRGLLGMDSA
jgi:hypothetical protein